VGGEVGVGWEIMESKGKGVNPADEEEELGTCCEIFF
jgi:hypothetical protein